MRIVNTDKLKVNVGVSEQIINKIYKDQKVDVKVKVATDQILKGTVKAVSPVPDQRTQIYPVEIEIDNADNLIKPGMFAEILFDIEKRDNVLAIPSGAVQEDNGKKYVYVVENGIVKKRDIEIGLDNGNYVEIKSGLKEKDKVVVKGQNYVEDGEKVKVVRGDK
jgi:RND family efflux transporter MFP subunit